MIDDTWAQLYNIIKAEINILLVVFPLLIKDIGIAIAKASPYILFVGVALMAARLLRIVLYNDTTFMGLCARNLAEPDDIKKYIQEWEDSGSSVPLYKYLGMTQFTYLQYSMGKNSIQNIVYKATYKK